MPSLPRLSGWLSLDFFASPQLVQSPKFTQRAVLRASACSQCHGFIQARRLAASSKPSIPPTSEDLSPPSASPSSPSPEESLSKNGPSHSGPEASDLPSASEHRRSALTKRFSSLMDNLQGNIFIASQRLNDLTGYSGIEELKTHITVLESNVISAQDAVRVARAAYKTTVADRASTQREVTTLLARKDSWTPSDLERFTSLYRNDHGNEQAVQESQTRLAESEREAEYAATQLSSSILSRYHEEQIWSDKIRRMSTWGTWGLMGVNVLLFLVFQFGFEPWRRARLVRGFEDKVKHALESVEKEKLAVLESQEIRSSGSGEFLLSTEPIPLTQDESTSASETEPIVVVESEVPPQARDSWFPTAILQLREPNTWKVAAEDLFSDRQISLSKQEVSIFVLEGVAAGAAIVSIMATVLLRHS